MPIRLAELAEYADELLGTKETPDYSNALNGVQMGHEGPVRGIAAAVDFSTRAIRGAMRHDANLLIVHHGMFWSGLEPLVDAALSRVRLLLENDIAVYASHLPLDRNADYGNNTLLARELELRPSRLFASYNGVHIGVAGDADLKTSTLASRLANFSRHRGGALRTTPIADARVTRRWGICTGAGATAETLKEAMSAGIDTLIVGEGPHWTAVFAEEHEITIMYAGHYATETLGVCALARHLSEKFHVPWTFVEAPTGL